MAMTRIALRAELNGAQTLSAALAATNSVMWDDLLATSVFITLLAVRYDPETREIRCVNGGHHPALVRHPSGQVEELTCRGMALGLVPETSYVEETEVLEPGALIVMFSDGVVEARAPDDGLYGTTRLRDLVSHAPGGKIG